jgi:hypothetical protein
MNATFKQRSYLYNLHTALGWPVVGIRDMSVEHASDAIAKAKAALEEKKGAFASKEENDERE